MVVRGSCGLRYNLTANECLAFDEASLLKFGLVQEIDVSEFISIQVKVSKILASSQVVPDV